ncbi:rhodanese-like domain-containing protein [Euzebya sp.]|uniref:rhodanese-like domain-containing protein n=1 Tax=Euzebya sp. TaxID=1971409 RepID=UPI003513D843
MAHAGDISPEEAWDVLEDDRDAVLVDVRTRAEWTYVGLPDLDDVDKAVVRIEWSTADGGRNEAFLDELDAEGLDPDTPVLFLCRSGARSAAAAEAATAHGYTRAHNVAGGFEGPRDAAGHRGTSAGWKAAGLPWTQS